MSADAAELAIGRLILLFGEPKAQNVSAWIAEYRLALVGFHDDAIRMGIDELLRTRTMRAWPSIGECVGACRAAGSKLGVKPSRLPWEREEEPDVLPTDEERARVNEMVRKSRAAMLKNSKQAFSSKRRPVRCDSSVFAERERKRQELRASQDWANAEQGDPVMTDERGDP
jgi:hypothetical protein